MRIHGNEIVIYWRFILMTKNIGEFLQELRKDKGLTQKGLAEQIGVSDKTISKWERGESIPDIFTIQQRIS